MRTIVGAVLVLSSCASQTAVPMAPAPRPVASVSRPGPTARLVHVQVLALNDFHGNLDPPHGHDGEVLAPGAQRIAAGGAAYLAAHITRLRGLNPNTVVVSAGDLTGASPLASSLFHDQPTILVMNRLGLDFEGIGNHDFDHGLAGLERLKNSGPAFEPPGIVKRDGEQSFPGAHFKYLAANVFGHDGKPVFAPYGIDELGGVKIAFIGLTLRETPTVTNRSAVDGLTFANEAATANALLPELREQGVATTVLLLHQGGFQEEGGTYDGCAGFHGAVQPILDALDPAFRVVVTGHTHQAYDCDIKGRRVTSAASYGRLITAIDLTIDQDKQELVDVRAQNVPVTRDIVPDAAVTKLVVDYEERALPVTERAVGYQRGSFTRDPIAAHSPSCETPLGDVIADAHLDATRNAGAVIALMQPGGIRADLVAAENPKSVQPIRFAAAFEIQPFGDRLITLSLTGSELHQVLERQFARDRPRVLAVSKGFTYRYAYDAQTKTLSLDPKSMRLDGKVIRPAGHYRVTVNSFLAEGGDDFNVLQNAPERVPGVLDVEAFVAFVGKTSSAAAPLTPSTKLDRIEGNACK